MKWIFALALVGCAAQRPTQLPTPASVAVAETDTVLKQEVTAKKDSTFTFPTLSRPDTRNIHELLGLDRAAFVFTVQAFRDSFPSETFVCYEGDIYIRTDTTLVVVDSETTVPYIVRQYSVNATTAQQGNVAFADSADVRPRTACNGLGVGHSHPFTNPDMGDKCTHSNQDALALTENQSVLFSLILCFNDNTDTHGVGEVLWRDGRRVPFTWDWPLAKKEQ